jgi:hypothetical protein
MARPNGLVTPLGVYLSPFAPHYPHPPQEAFLAIEAEEALYGGAARGGKSDALLMAALQFVEVPGYSAIIFRRISPDLHGADGLVPRSKEWLTPVLGDRAWNGDRLSWTFPSGATLRFGHMQYEDDVFKFQGHAYQFIGFDELTHFTERQYRYMFSRMSKPSEGPLSQVPLRMRSSSNPGGPGHRWVKRRLIDRLHDPEDPQDSPQRAAQRVFIPAKVDDNPSIDRDAYKRQLGHLEPEIRAQLLNGDWNARQPGDWFFEDGHLDAVEALGREHEWLLARGEMPAPAGGELHIGLDAGEHVHGLLLWPTPLGGTFVVREYVAEQTEAALAAGGVVALNTFGFPLGRVRYDDAHKWGVRSMVPVFVAASHRDSRHVMSRVPFNKFKGPTAQYLRRLARLAHSVQVGGLSVSPRCPELLRQLRGLERDPESVTGVWRKADDQHGPDALIAGEAPNAERNRLRVAA